ncbi:MAG: hypothetical protein K0R12_1269 [Gammaproteobacteria bacterium]|jgi:hypothetical protein|nr:hypothetical protein [Gammaproteobacteria bacterium]
MSNEIAKTILAQMGGNKFLAMVPIKIILAKPNGVIFHLKGVFNKVSVIDVTLNSMDLYDVKYFGSFNRKTLDRKLITQSDGIYFDMLQSDFTSTTGLSTYL